jgi:hypothetical protein
MAGGQFDHLRAAFWPAARATADIVGKALFVKGHR